MVLLFLLAGALTSSAASPLDSYVGDVATPAQLALLEEPLDTASATFAGDMTWWVWGKTLRNTPRGEQASWESLAGIERMCSIYSQVLGVEISQENTPAIYRLMSRAGNTGANYASPFVQANPRKRPYVLMNDTAWGEFNTPGTLQPNASYPSSPMTYCMSTALALAQAFPILQDTIVRRAVEYGTSSVITGAHWQSDVDAATMCATAAIAKARASNQFSRDIKAAQNEYSAMRGITVSQIKGSPRAFPVMTRILDNPLTTSDYLFLGDLERYWACKPLRDSTERGQLANADMALNDQYFIDIFNECTGINISQSETPHIAFLIKTLSFLLNSQTNIYKREHFRRRPYSQFKETYPYGGVEWSLTGESSYPSRHALVGWGVALALAEVITHDQDSILLRGMEYGESRVIKGMAYASDVAAARLMAACTLGKLRNEQSIVKLFDNAKREYLSLTSWGDVNGDGAVNSTDITVLYNWLLNNDDSAIINGDLNGDGNITSSDVTIVYNIILGN